MSRSRAFLLSLVLSLMYFGFERAKNLFGIESELENVTPLLLVVFAFLILVVTPRSVVLYGGFILVAMLIDALLSLQFESVASLANVSSMFVSFLLGAGMVILLKRLRKVVWKSTQRFSRTHIDPWVAIDQGIDPTLESDKEAV